MIICSSHCAKPYPVSNIEIGIQWMKEATNKHIMQTIANIYRNAKPRKLFSYALRSDKAIKYTECVCFHSPTTETRERRPIWSKQIFDITGLQSTNTHISVPFENGIDTKDFTITCYRSMSQIICFFEIQTFGFLLLRLFSFSSSSSL